MKQYLFPLFAIVLVLVSCSEPEDINSANLNYIMKNDFESLAGWIPTNGSLNTEQAHSGKYSIKADKGQEYSMGFSDFLGKVSTRKPHKVKLSCWAYLLSSKANAQYQLQILDPITGRSIFQDGIILADKVQGYGTWVKAEKTIDLPENITSTHEIRVFLWLASAEEPTYIDDVALSIIE